MLLPVSLKSVVETNLLLRALWAQLREEFGKLAWQLSPIRFGDEKTIYFGWADIDLGVPVHIGVTYERRGVANALIFEDTSGQESRIKQCLIDALISVHTPQRYSFTVPIQMSLNLYIADAEGEVVQLLSNTKGSFLLKIAEVCAFDTVDSQVELRRRVGLILDALSFLTNLTFQISTSEHSTDFLCVAHDAVVNVRRPSTMPDPVWLENHPTSAGMLVLDAPSIKLLDTLAGDMLDDKVVMLADAAHHFHSGIIAEMQRSLKMSCTSSEQAVVFYLSALEVASLIGAPEPKSCSTCGQPQHKISARVTDFVEKWLGVHVVGLIKMLYSSRSAYLHRGALLSSRSYCGETIPQLDPSSISGVLAQMPLAPLSNLREFTSYCLRRVAFDLLD
jgi:hypothetical protein